jgi:YVTN family beta-propeller protein
VRIAHVAAAAFTIIANAATLPPLRPVATILLPAVQGRIDHMSCDLTGQRLFVAALGNNTVEVINLKSSKTINSIKGFRAPQGVAYDAASNRLVVASRDVVQRYCHHRKNRQCG